MDPRRHGLSYQFVYAALEEADAAASRGLIKVAASRLHRTVSLTSLLQMRARASAVDPGSEACADGGITWRGQNVWCGEPLFVANGEGSDEDDGCVLCTCYDAVEQRSFLLLLQVPRPPRDRDEQRSVL
jgi:carotenoid cleavage dioxygenase-like enzyme